MAANIKAIIKQLGSSSVVKRRSAIVELSRIVPSHPSIVRVLLAMSAADSDERVRDLATAALKMPIHQEILRDQPALAKKKVSSRKGVLNSIAALRRDVYVEIASFEREKELTRFAEFQRLPTPTIGLIILKNLLIAFQLNRRANRRGLSEEATAEYQRASVRYSITAAVLIASTSILLILYLLTPTFKPVIAEVTRNLPASLQEPAATAIMAGPFIIVLAIYFGPKVIREIRQLFR